jgi:hypothetical protein
VTFIKDDLPFLAAQWIDAKAEETAAQERRRQIEDQMAEALRINPAIEGQQTTEAADYKVKVNCRMTRKVDGDLLQDIAIEHGLTDHLYKLFRWKPDLNLKEWKAAAPEVTGALAAAITTTAGRPSFSIEVKE